jgi:hypothetical protein
MLMHQSYGSMTMPINKSMEDAPPDLNDVTYDAFLLPRPWGFS